MRATAPEDYNQPVTLWGHLWRTAGCLIISGLAWGDIAHHQWGRGSVWFWIDLGAGLFSLGLVFFRRRWPLGVALTITLLGLVSAATAGPAALAVVSLATRRKVPQILGVGVTSVITGQLYSYYQPTGGQSPPPWLNFTFIVAVTVAVSVFGMYVGSRRELLWTLRERARQAEAEQELRLDQARSAERERIAREMHDVLAHRISLVAMHAGALAFRDDLPADQVRETARVIQASAHEALMDLRQVLGVLRGGEGEAARPQPTLADLPALVAEAADGGMVVELEEDLVEQPDERIGRTAYRIVQEALTNARKHAVGAHVSVRICGDPEDGLKVVISNATRVGVHGMPVTPGAGLGLVGLRERAELAGGRLQVDTGPDEFVLRGWLPWTP